MRLPKTESWTQKPPCDRADNGSMEGTRPLNSKPGDLHAGEEGRDEKGPPSRGPFAKKALSLKQLLFPSPRPGPSLLRLSQGLLSEVCSRYNRDSIGYVSDQRGASSQENDRVKGLQTHQIAVLCVPHHTTGSCHNIRCSSKNNYPLFKGHHLQLHSYTSVASF